MVVGVGGCNGLGHRRAAGRPRQQQLGEAAGAWPGAGWAGRPAMRRPRHRQRRQHGKHVDGCAPPRLGTLWVGGKLGGKGQR